MISRITGQEYGDVNIAFVDSATHLVLDHQGVGYCELEDCTWIIDGDVEGGALRYSWTYAHAGGVVLKPLCQLIGGVWVDLITGEEVPTASKRAYA